MLPLEKGRICAAELGSKVPSELSLRVDCIPAAMTDLGIGWSQDKRTICGKDASVAPSVLISPSFPGASQVRERMKPSSIGVEAPRGEIPQVHGWRVCAVSCARGFWRCRALGAGRSFEQGTCAATDRGALLRLARRREWMRLLRRGRTRRRSRDRVDPDERGHGSGSGDGDGSR